MKVISVKEQKDGSAIVELDVTEEDKDLLISLGFNTMLRMGMEYDKNLCSGCSCEEDPTCDGYACEDQAIIKDDLTKEF